MNSPQSTCQSSRKTLFGSFLAAALLIATPLVVKATVITIDFDSVGATPGVDATGYLASYGITLTGVGPSAPFIYDDQNFYGTGVVDATSGRNFLLQQSAVYGGSFTMNFASPLSGVAFTRIANLTPNLVGTWTASVYSGATLIGTAGEGFGLGGFSAVNYSFTGSNITSMTISGNGYGAAGMSSLMMDNLKLTTPTVPDEWSTALLTVFGCLMVVATRVVRRR